MFFVKNKIFFYQIIFRELILLCKYLNDAFEDFWIEMIIGNITSSLIFLFNVNRVKIKHRCYLVISTGFVQAFLNKYYFELFSILRKDEKTTRHFIIAGIEKLNKDKGKNR